MKFRDLFSLAVRNLWRRKLRTFLTVLGVVIGCASIVIMMSFGLAQKKQMSDLVDSTNSLTTINVSPTQFYDPSMGGKKPSKGIITDKVLEDIKAIPEVSQVISKVPLGGGNQSNYKVSIDKYSLMGSLEGISPENVEALELEIVEGRMFEPGSKDLELIVSEDFNYNLYDEKNANGSFEPIEIDPLKAKIRLEIGNIYSEKNPLTEFQGIENTKTERVKAKIVGVYKGGGFMMFGSGVYGDVQKVEEINDKIDKLTLGDKEYREKKRNHERTYENISVYVDDVDQIEKVTQDIESMDLNANSDSSWIQEMQAGTNVASAILTGIGSISLIVAAIGITNTMVMSIYERTKEIGVMKVIGASVKDIRNMFLLEAGMIGLFGGIIGLLLSLGASNLLNDLFMNTLGQEGGMDASMKISIIPVWLGVSALFFSFVIGVITGYYPAKRATKLSAIDAIRTE